MYEDIDLTHPSMLRKSDTRRKSNDSWPTAHNRRGPQRQPGWSKLILVIDGCIEDLVMGNEPQFREIHLCSSITAADKMASRLRTEYSSDLPKGVWIFKSGDILEGGITQVLAKYSPRRFSEVENIPGVPEETIQLWLQRLQVYAEKRKRAQEKQS